MKPGALMREKSPVSSIASDMRSTWAPLYTDLRKVIGVRVVTSSSPTEMEKEY